MGESRKPPMGSPGTSGSCTHGAGYVQTLETVRVLLHHPRELSPDSARAAIHLDWESRNVHLRRRAAIHPVTLRTRPVRFGDFVRELGTLQVKEEVGDDLKPGTSGRKSKPDFEGVCFVR